MPIRRPTLPRPSVAPPETLFTVASASRTLPYVGRIAEDLVHDHARWREAVRGVEVAAASRRAEAGAAAADGESQVLQRRAQMLAADIQHALGELAALGIACKSIETGLLDFPAIVNGEPAHLCWQVGEPAIAWWHPRDAGFAGRRPLDGAIVAEPAPGRGVGDGGSPTAEAS